MMAIILSMLGVQQLIKWAHESRLRIWKESITDVIIFLTYSSVQSKLKTVKVQSSNE